MEFASLAAIKSTAPLQQWHEAMAYQLTQARKLGVALGAFLTVAVACNERLLWGMKTSSRRQGQVAAVGSVRRPSPGRTGMRRFRTLAEAGCR
jgi:hypothetical protein